ncbi:MAG: RluA family pseudouridine synthase [Thermomicrobiales bacterium]|nr:RluA family pseudouridine synthase [Thermomicrobiales bacterium]MCO5220911.1 RluA family pseudouridine synthase [Thermomicrobiales bacterium]
MSDQNQLIDDADDQANDQQLEFHPTATSTGERLDVYLATELPDYSRNFVQQLIADGQVLVDGEARKRTFKVTAGQVVQVTIPETQSHDIQPQEIPLDIVYEDVDIAVIDKPAGMVVHPAAGHPDGTLVNGLLARYPEIAINGTNRPGIVHRLDKDTSGLIVVARTPQGQRLLLEQWADGSVEKGYKALVHGVVEPNEATIDAPIGRDPIDRQRMAVIGSGKPAVTHFDVEERFDAHTYLDVNIETGRTHQIRVHLAFIGHPVVADPLYARGGLPTLGLERQFLHAWQLGLRLSDGRRIVLESPLPSELEAILADLRRGSMG